MSAAPLTTKAHGSTRCVECSKKFEDTPERPTILVEATETGWSGTDSSGQFRRSLTPVTVNRRWHVDCYQGVQDSIAAYREQARQDTRETIRQIAKDAGMDVEEALATFDRRNPPVA